MQPILTDLLDCTYIPFLCVYNALIHHSYRKVLVLQSEDVITAHYVRVHKQTFLLEWFGDQSMRVKHLDHSMGLNSDVFNPPAITTFTQSSKVYLTVFHGTVVEIFEFDENATETFVLKQQMNLKSYNITSHSRISATPFWK